MNVRVVNMIPSSRSGESNQDSEPQIAINPSNPQQIVGTAFTPNPDGGANAPIYVSVDGGTTWILNAIVPGNGFVGTGDITVRFGDSGVLYAGILRGDGFLQMNILRTSTFSAPTTMSVLVSRSFVDQPYVETKGSGGTDRVYVGSNDVYNGGVHKKATIDRSLNASSQPPPAGFGTFPLDPRPNPGQDGPSVRTAIHSDGTVYAAYLGWRTALPSIDSLSSVLTDIVIARDDQWAIGPNPFTALVDPNDNLAGLRVATSVPINWFSPLLDQERIGSHLAVAVDPNNSSSVWIAWADNAAGPYTIRVRHSTNRGQTWSADVRTITNATNPALAVSDDGQVGFLYQQVSSGRWITHLELTFNDWSAPPTDIQLATVPTGTPPRQFFPYMGDYDCLTTWDNNFFGVFCCANTPTMVNFPNGVVYQRNANFQTATLLANDNVTPVPVSIDPFFFSVDNGNMWLVAQLEAIG